MRLLIFGSTGMLGRVLMSAAKARGIEAVGAARSGADCDVDAASDGSLNSVLKKIAPTAIVNCIAVTDLNACERDPDNARAINALFPKKLASLSPDVRLIQISTDHFFTGDTDRAHTEDAPVQLVNEYASTKFAAEQFVAPHDNALIIRTNIVGCRGWRGRPTFLEWAVAALERGDPIAGFTDYYTSPIDSVRLAECILDLLDSSATGVLNVASREVSSKYRFLRSLADAMGKKDADIKRGTVKSLDVPRAESAGLDVRRAEGLLGKTLPTLDEVIGNAIRQRAAFAAFQG